MSKQKYPLILGAELVRRSGEDPYTIVRVRSESNPGKQYRVDVVNKRCSCPAWIYSKSTPRFCKHLRALGFKAEEEKTNQGEFELAL